VLSFQTLKTKLFAPVDALTSSLFLRLFGFIIVVQAYSYAQYDFIEQGILAPKFLFSFDGFSFIKPLPEGIMKGMLLLILISGILLIVNKFIKFALASFLLCFSYFFLLDKSYYNNHFYLFILLAFIFLFYKEKTDPSTQKKQIPYWFLLLLQIQIVIVYFYGGIAKLNTDWLLHQQPLQILLDGTKQNALLPDLNTSTFALYLLTYGGLLFDLSIGFLLWAKKTRKLGILLSLGFNLSNIVLFNFGDNGAIGGFPMFMIFSLLLFIDPASVRSYLAQWGLNNKNPNSTTTANNTATTSFDKQQNLVLIGLGIYLSFQLLFPFRQFLYTGNTSWTARGSKFSWRMKAHTKIPDIRFFGRPSPKDSLREINVGKMINSMQRYQMGEDPVMIVQFAHFIGKEFKDNGASQPEVYAHARISLNGRPYFAIIDSTRDLLKVEHHIFAADDWIRPLSPSELQQIK
jgi:vitamin K-dependent gamma-carboxylase